MEQTETPQKDSKALRIDVDLYEWAAEIKPRYFTITTFINHMLESSLRIYNRGLTTYDKMGKPTDKEREKEKERKEVLPNSYIIDNNNKEKNKKSKKGIHLPKTVPEDLIFCEDLLKDFWVEKSGEKTQHAWKYLCNQLLRIKELYGSDSVCNQLKAGTANRWKSITLVNYEKLGKPQQKGLQEPMTSHPAQKVFTAEGGFES
tara:strand:+ start:80 stop:688 length:609 start_codon:yes stop_codon:yes gene_type:complete